MPDKSQARTTPETKISVDLNAADDSKAVTRTNSDIGRDVRDQDRDAPSGRSKPEREMFKRMKRLETNLTAQFDQRQAESEARHQRELSELKATYERSGQDRDGADAADAAHEAAINVLKDKLAAAYEKGDSAASADITLQISKLDAQFWAKKEKAAGATTREASTERGAAGTTAATTTQRKTGPTIAGSRFIRANEDWWEDDEFLAENAACNAIYIDLVTKQGFDPKDDETFKEVAKRLKEKFPTLAVKAGRKDPDDEEDEDADDRTNDRGEGETRQRRAAAARIDDRGPAGERERGNRRTLSKDEIATMKACRLDPENDKDVVAFLREAVALEAQS